MAADIPLILQSLSGPPAELTEFLPIMATEILQFQAGASTEELILSEAAVAQQVARLLPALQERLLLQFQATAAMVTQLLLTTVTVSEPVTLTCRQALLWSESDKEYIRGNKSAVSAEPVMLPALTFILRF